MSQDREWLEEGQADHTLGINVTKIVKYVCITAVLVVGIIFGTQCIKDKK